MGFSEMLLDPELTEEHRNEAASVIVKSSQHLLSIVDDILDYSKIEAGKLDIERITISTEALLKELEQIASFKATEKGINFKVEKGNSIPEYFVGDPTRIKQVIFNFLSNAIKFTENGGVVLKIAASDKSLTFSVVDTGIGLTPEQLKKIFAPFVQAEMSTTRKFGGTGLGLAISSMLANAMRGRINVESKISQGSTFSLEIPLEINLEEISSTAPVIENKVISVSGKKVLLADDSSDNQDLVKFFLSKEGIIVKSAETGLQALQLAKEEQFDLILMDLHMPEMDGIKATSEIRKLGMKLPIIALTASVTEEDRDAFSKAGVNDSIRKPFQKSGLTETVRKYLTQFIPVESTPEIDQSIFKIVEKFVGGLEQRFIDIERYFTEESWAELAFSAHSLCSAGIFGFQQLGQSAAELEQAASKSDFTKRKEAFDKVKTRIKECQTQDPKSWNLPS